MKRPAPRNIEGLYREIIRRDARIKELKETLARKEMGMEMEMEMDEERKAVITVRENEDIDIEMELSPDAEGSSVCGELAAIGFGAIVRAYNTRRFAKEQTKD